MFGSKKQDSAYAEEELAVYLSGAIYYLSCVAVSCLVWFGLRRVLTRVLQNHTYNVFATVHALIVGATLSSSLTDTLSFSTYEPITPNKEFFLLYTCGYHLHVFLELSYRKNKLLLFSTVCYILSIIFVLLNDVGTKLLLLYMFLVESCTPSLCLASFMQQGSSNLYIVNLSKGLALCTVFYEQILIGYSMAMPIAMMLPEKEKPACYALTTVFFFSLLIRLYELSKLISGKQAKKKVCNEESFWQNFFITQ
ncbi:uncharacterized protein LOC106661249 [Cimex lectularius]|uniref:Uncharacterized protein n=1 Tax=Cimex lectularius TaxID=79782 RepID=A0A8I6RA41_CIMLE|nr:uncharacterized protein LOC106661249 [Cimex lectularius]